MNKNSVDNNSLFYLFNNSVQKEKSFNPATDFLSKSLRELCEKEAVIYETDDESDNMTPGEEIAHIYMDAIRGEHIAEAVLGSFYFEGKRLKQDFKEAFHWCLKAAEYGIGMDEQQYYVGRMYELGKGVKRDNKKAVEWYIKASSQENILATVRLSEFFLKEK